MNNKRLEEFDLIIGDGNYSSKYPKSEEFLNVGIPFLSASDFADKTIDYNNSKKISPELHSQLKKGHVQKGDLLIVVRGNGVGKTGFIDDEIDECNINAQLAFVRSNDANLDTEYLYYNMKCNYEKLKSLATGSAQPQLVIGNLVKYLLNVPSIELQIKIRNILSNIDDKIKLNNEINNNLYEMQKCYFGEIFKEKEYYEIRLDDLFMVSAGGDAPKDKKELSSDEYKYPIVSNGIENEGIYGYSKEYKIDKKSVTISARGTIGYKVLRNYNYYPIVRLISVIPKDDSISSEYLFYALDDIQILGTGTTQQQLTIPMVKDIKIKVYDVDLIKKFTDYSISLNKKIDNNKIENKRLEELRDTLLPKLMNGEIDLDNIEI